jgi:hypothetical protein
LGLRKRRIRILMRVFEVMRPENIEVIVLFRSIFQNIK